MKVKKQIVLLIIAIASPVYADATDSSEKGMDFISLIKECAPMVAPQTMAAIVKTESQFQPWAIGINGNVKLTRQPNNKAEAVATAQSLIAQGYNIDMGLGQINSANLDRTGLSIESVFEPCTNLAVSAAILQANYQSATKKLQGEQSALHAALSAYNTGSFTKGFKNGYVQKVVKNAGAVATAPIVPAITTIPLEPAQATQQPATKLHQQTVEPPVKLTVEGASTSINVYSNAADSVMVY
ncbi:lytic transglycosylase domain-containing protein [Methylobacter sp.]|uniref:lytic transglycosylase domain-containing protein n=1 Tax=Methylobacter sp. TaxID=2051955 RepID=UPI003DA511CA